MIANAVRDRPLPVYGDGMNVRDWIHVEDHCRGLLAALEKGQVGEVYNFGASSERHNIDIVKQVLSLVGKPESLIQYVKDRLGHDRRYAIDSSKAQAEAELGAAPPIRGGALRDRSLVRREPPLVGADHLRRVPQVLREAVRGRTVKVAVTGANGMLGGEAVAQLAGRHEVLALGFGPGRPPEPRPIAGSRRISGTAGPWRARCSSSARRRCFTPER